MTYIKTKIQIIMEVLDNRIKNLEPGFRQTLIDQLVLDDRISSIRSCERIVRSSYLDLPKNGSSRTKLYWVRRGWSDQIAEIKSSVIAKELVKKFNKKSPYSIDFWLNKINPVTGDHYTESEAEFERNSRRPIRKEYWINRGYSECEAILLANNTKSNNNKKGANGSKTRTHEQVRVDSHRCPEYWLSRGYTLEEAQKQISRNQNLFSKDICIEKYGPEEGLRIWNDRQIKWLASLKQSGLHGGYSKIANELFAAIEIDLPNIKYGKDECLLYTKDLAYFVDCVMLENKRVIEFYGDYWHANPTKFNKDSIVKKLTAESIWNKDAEKNKRLHDSGYTVLVVWESEYRNNKQQVINECINFLTK